MTRIEFFVNVADKPAKVTELCDKALAKNRQLTVFSPDHAMNELLRRRLWLHSATSFLPSAQPEEAASQHVSIILDADGSHLIQDDILINLRVEYPPFFSRFRYLAELVGLDEEDKITARIRYKFYKDRGYDIKTTDVTA